MRPLTREIISIIAFVWLFSGTVFAETITLKSGKQVEGAILEKTKDYIKIRWNGTDIYYQMKYIRTIENAEGSDKQSPDAGYLQSGLTLAAAGNFEEAEAEFRSQLSNINGALDILEDVKKGALTKEYATFLFQSSLSLSKGDLASAIVSLLKARELSPKDPDVNYNLGAAYLAVGDYDKARTYLFNSLRQRPEDTQAYALLAKTYLNTGQYKKAQEYLLVAKTLSEKNGDTSSLTEIDSLLQSIPPQP